jgi:hypothetical protein
MSCQTAFSNLFTREVSYDPSVGSAVLSVLPTLVIAFFGLASFAVYRRGDRVVDLMTSLLSAFGIGPVALLAFGTRELIKVARCEGSDALTDRLDEWSILITVVPIAVCAFSFLNALCARQIEIFTMLLLTALSGACGALDYVRATRCATGGATSLCRVPLMAMQLWVCVVHAIVLLPRCGASRRPKRAEPVGRVRFVDPLYNATRGTNTLPRETPSNRAFF